MESKMRLEKKLLLTIHQGDVNGGWKCLIDFVKLCLEDG
jgi:hypothetical protein